MQNNQEISAASGMRKLLYIVKYEWLKHFRKNRLYITLIISMFILLLLNILLPYIMGPIIGESFTFPPEEPVDFFTGQFSPLGGIWFVLVFLAIFFGSDSMSAEFENRTGLLLFPNPLRRESVVLGKFIASMLMATIVLTVYYLVTWIFGIVFYGNAIWSLSIPYLWSFGMAILIMTGLLATTFMFSAIFNKSMTTSIVVFVVFLIAMNIISGIFTLAVGQGNFGFEPWYLLSYNSDLIARIMNYPADRIIEIIGPGGTTYRIVPDIFTGILTTIIGYIIIPLIASTLIYKKREL